MVNRNLRALLLLAASLLVIGAFASAAQAGVLDPEGAGTATTHGEQTEEGVFTLTDNGGLTTKCTTATYSGTLPEEGTSTPTVHPEYSGCTAFGLKATVTTTGCNFLTHLGEEVETGAFEGAVDVECEAGKSISITAGTCEVKVDPQTGLKKVKVTNTGGAGNKMDILIHVIVSKIKYTVVKDGFLCPLTGEGKEFTEADLNSTVTEIALDKNGNQIGLTVRK